MRLTVCELPNDPAAFESRWTALADHVSGGGGEWVLLPEMPFSPWLSASGSPSAEAWKEAVATHEAWLSRLAELGARVVVGTRPVVDGGRRFNEAFVWASDGGVRALHRKTYLPDEAGFREATWYDRGPVDFEVAEVAGVRIGVLICTELWFQHHAREYAHAGAELVLVPRATLFPSTEKWVAGGRAAAVVSGAYCVSSNFGGPASDGATWGGNGWVIEPEEGDVVARTSPGTPFVTSDLDLAVARRAKTTYPRYVAE